MRLILWMLPIFLAAAHSPATTWKWDIPADVSNGVAHAECTTFLYGKDWAYAVEIDDGPSWVRPFAVPFLGQYQWTDAPPVLAGRGIVRPFVGGVAVIVSALGASNASVNWDDIDALLHSGWGVLNHSWAHSYVHWDAQHKITSAQARDDAYWSQTVLAGGLATGRAPTAAVYANGTVDYNLDGALTRLGICIATRVGSAGPTDVTSAQLNLMDFPRNYLDEGPWSTDGKSDPMSGIPSPGGAGPAAGSFIIDFTHHIDQATGSANYQRWQQRLSIVARNWGAAGRDNVWVAPTDAVANYVRAARAATVVYAGGQLTVSVPDDLPGSALTIRLMGSRAKALPPPPGGAVYVKDGTVWLTTPPLGQLGSAVPRMVCAYDGPAGEITFGRPVAVAGISAHFFGEVPAGPAPAVTLRTAKGDVPTPLEPFEKGGWTNAARLCAFLPGRPAVLATGVSVGPFPSLQKVRVWTLASPIHP